LIRSTRHHSQPRRAVPWRHPQRPGPPLARRSHGPVAATGPGRQAWPARPASHGPAPPMPVPEPGGGSRGLR